MTVPFSRLLQLTRETETFSIHGTGDHWQQQYFSRDDYKEWMTLQHQEQNTMPQNSLHHRPKCSPFKYYSNIYMRNLFETFDTYKK